MDYISPAVKCTSLLILTVSLGNSGRAAIRAIAVGLILCGPIHNMISNGEETVRSFSCTSSLVYNLTHTKNNLLVKPFSNAISNLQGDINELKDLVDSLRRVLNPISQEFLDETEISFLVEENDEIDQFLGGKNHSNEIEKKYYNLLNILDKEKRENLTSVTGEETELKYKKKIELRCNNGLASAVENCQNIFKKSHERCYNLVDSVDAWRICWPLKLNVVCNLFDEISEENICDADSNLPHGFGAGYQLLIKTVNELKKEMENIHIHYTLNKPNINTSQLLSFLPEVGTISAIFIMDRLLYEALELVTKHAQVNFSQSDKDKITLFERSSVRGTGIVARHVRLLLRGFDAIRNTNLSYSNQGCLPDPKLLPTKYLIEVGIMYTIVLLLILVDGYTSRLSLLVCAHVYPKREKKRILYLYNETLKKRVKYNRYIKEILRTKSIESRIEMESDVLLTLRLKYPCFNWLKIINAGRRHCFICKEIKTIRKSQAKICPTCDGYYCWECWKDASFNCYICNPPVIALHQVSSDETVITDNS